MADVSLTIMSFNLRYDNAEDGTNAWSAGRGDLAAYLVRKYRPAVLAVQEGLLNQLKLLEDRLSGYLAPHIGCGRFGGTNSEHCAIFYDVNMLEVEASGDFWLSEHALVPGSTSWNSAFPRICTWAVFHLKSCPNMKFSVWNTHLDYANELVREKGLEVILQFQRAVIFCF